jgi:hypothetical protein
MARYYSLKQQTKLLHQLGIEPIEGMITGREAAAILTWRAKQEEQVEHKYTPAALRRHRHCGNLTSDTTNTRMSRYPIDQVFQLPLSPRQRGRPPATKELKAFSTGLR